ncbi:MAG: hypothetical protein F4146_04250 [Rhodothermaceae bacterium]|nr:hypothetical protein [Rhodothermaceae bacterium]MYH07757.1 hypothetical protein [Rhodothermaceae bacterium]
MTPTSEIGFAGGSGTAVGLLLLLTVACGQNASTTTDTQTDKAPSDSPERYIIDDADPPSSGIRAYRSLEADSALIVDSRNGIFLLVSDRRVSTLGASGEGACEFQRVTSLSVVGDTVFVLDRLQGRLLGYSIRSGECLSEFSSRELNKWSAMIRVGGSFYFTMNRFNAATAPETALLSRMDTQGNITPLDLRKSDLGADLLLANISTVRLAQIKEKDGVVYFLLPFTHKVWAYNIRENRVSNFDLVHDSPDISNMSDSRDLAALSEVVGKIESEIDIFLFDAHLVVASRNESGWMRSQYSYSGELLAREEVSGDLHLEEGGEFYELVAIDDLPRAFVFTPIELKNSSE